jgi:hypothetical protein
VKEKVTGNVDLNDPSMNLYSCYWFYYSQMEQWAELTKFNAGNNIKSRMKLFDDIRALSMTTFGEI